MEMGPFVIKNKVFIKISSKLKKIVLIKKKYGLLKIVLSAFVYIKTFFLNHKWTKTLNSENYSIRNSKRFKTI